MPYSTNGQGINAGRRVRIREAAELLGCSTRLAQKLCITGELPASKVGKIWTLAPSEIEAYLVRRQPGPALAHAKPARAAGSLAKARDLTEIHRHYDELMGSRKRGGRGG